MTRSDNEVDCIASVVWHEARGQQRTGQIAVAEVVVRRRDSGRYPRTACGVVRQRAQFSFVRRGIIPRVPAADAPRMRQIALGVMEGRLRSPVRGAMFFHAAYASPGWDRRIMGRIGAHVFYR